MGAGRGDEETLATTGGSGPQNVRIDQATNKEWEDWGKIYRESPKDAYQKPMPQAPRSRILELAEEAVSDRHKKNDIPERNFARIAQCWSAILDTLVTPEQVGLMMVGLKLVREAYSHQDDNLVDIIGYTLCLDEMTKE
jgi:hypothetical protein